MAIKPDDLFPGSTVPGNANYPQGQAQDESSPGADDGTPLVADVLNDVWGLLQAVLREASIAPSGNPDTAIASQYLEGIKAIAGTQGWVELAVEGADLSVAFQGQKVTGLGPTAVAVLNATADTLSYYEFDTGTETWSLVGTPFSFTSTAARGGIAAMGTTAVAVCFEGDGDLGYYEFDTGTETWSLVGSLLNTSISVSDIAFLGDNRIAITDDTANTIRAYEFDTGTETWSTVGAAASIGTVLNPSIAALNGTDVAIADSSTDSLRLFRFDEAGDAWTQVGNAYSFGTSEFDTVAALDGSTILHLDRIGDALEALRFDGTDWTPTLSIPIALDDLTAIPAIAIMGRERVAFTDTNLDVLRSYKITRKGGNTPPAVSV